MLKTVIPSSLDVVLSVVRRIAAFVLLFLATGSILIGRPMCCVLPVGDDCVRACCVTGASPSSVEHEEARDLEGDGTCYCCGGNKDDVRDGYASDGNAGDHVSEQDPLPAPSSPLVCDCPYGHSLRTGVSDIPADVPVLAFWGEAVLRALPMPVEVSPFANRRDETAHGPGGRSLPLLL